MTPQWLAKVLAEHWCGAAHPGLSLRRDPDHEDGRLRLGACFDCQRHASHVAAAVWAEFTARAQQAREDVAEAIRTAALPSWLRDADAAIAALLRAMGGGQ